MATAVVDAPQRSRDTTRSWPDLAGPVAFAVLALASAGYLLYLGRRTSFFFDEWNFVLDRRGWRPGTFLVPHNGHFVALPVLAFHLLFATVGLHWYLPYRLLLMACHLAACYLLYRYAQHRVGPLAALVPAGLMLLLGPAVQTLLWPFQIAFIGALVFGTAAFLLLDGPCTRRRSLLAVGCLLAALGCSGVGIAMVAGAWVRVLGRRQWRRWWVVGVPTLLFLAWYARYARHAPGNPKAGGTPAELWGYFRHAYLAAIGSLTGHTATQDRTLALWLAIAVLVLVLGRLGFELWHRRLPVGLLAAIATAVVLWGLTALTRARYQDYGASRYLYTGAFVVLLAIVEALRGLRFRLVAVAGLVIAAAASVWSGLDVLQHGARSLSVTDTYVRADLAALQLSVAGDSPPPLPTYHPSRRRAPQVTVGRYRSAIADLGSPAMPVSALPGQSAGVRTDVDRVLREAGDLRVTSAAPPTGPAAPVTVIGGATTQFTPPTTGCQLVRASGPGDVLLRFALPPAGVRVSSPASVVLVVRRYGPNLVGLTRVPAGRTELLRPLADRSPVPWVVQLGANQPITVCGS